MKLTLVCLASGAVGFAVAKYYLAWSTSAIICKPRVRICVRNPVSGTTIVAAYLPSYLDGSEYKGLAPLLNFADANAFTVNGRYWDWFARLGIFRWLMAYFPASVEFEVKAFLHSMLNSDKISGFAMSQEPVDPNKQYMFCSHPHGTAVLFLCSREHVSREIRSLLDSPRDLPHQLRWIPQGTARCSLSAHLAPALLPTVIDSLGG